MFRGEELGGEVTSQELVTFCVGEMLGGEALGEVCQGEREVMGREGERG